MNAYVEAYMHAYQHTYINAIHTWHTCIHTCAYTHYENINTYTTNIHTHTNNTHTHTNTQDQEPYSSVDISGGYWEVSGIKILPNKGFLCRINERNEASKVRVPYQFWVTAHESLRPLVAGFMLRSVGVISQFCKCLDLNVAVSMLI